MNILQFKLEEVAEYSDFLSLVKNFSYVQSVPLKSIYRSHLAFSEEEEEVYFLRIENPSPREVKIYSHVYRQLKGGVE